MILLLKLHVLIPPVIHPLLIEKFNLAYQPFFVLKDISKVFLVPCANFGLKRFEFLLETIHYCTRGAGHFLEPLGDQILKVLMIQP